MPGVCMIAGRVLAFPAERLAKNALVNSYRHDLDRGLWQRCQESLPQ